MLFFRVTEPLTYKRRINLKERIVVDTSYFNRNNPNAAVYVTAFNRSQKAGLLMGGDNADAASDVGGCDTETDASYGHGSFDEDPDGMPVSHTSGHIDGHDVSSEARSTQSNSLSADHIFRYDGHFPDDDKESKRPPLTDEQILICSPNVRGYALTSKLWLVSRKIRSLFFSSSSERCLSPLLD